MRARARAAGGGLPALDPDPAVVSTDAQPVNAARLLRVRLVDAVAIVDAAFRWASSSEAI